VQFDEGDNDWPHVAWSLVVDLDEAPDEKRETHGWVWFLAGDSGAPTHLLVPRARFSLYEGRRRVAVGEILGVEPHESPGEGL
jgi:hypothetical protein